MERPLKLIYIYADQDEKLQKELENFLVPLRAQGWIEDWQRRKILAGACWQEEFQTHLEAASLVLVLLSPDLLAGDLLDQPLLQDALKGLGDGTARVIPILLRPCDWKGTPLGHLQSLPRNQVPVVQWSHRETAFGHIAEEIRHVVDAQVLLPQQKSAQERSLPPLRVVQAYFPSSRLNVRPLFKTRWIGLLFCLLMAVMAFPVYAATRGTWGAFGMTVGKQNESHPPTGAVHSCPLKDACIYPDTAGNGYPTYKFYNYSVYPISNQYGNHLVYNNQIEGAQFLLCTDSNGSNCPLSIPAGASQTVNLTPINSVKLTR